ncbi:DUF3095 domain-containing protein [Chloroflexales bacterium ZM16-3]|nr:DUF3095 domain-containing protein [Chloroflexales bacterium ZM16-3]
MMESFYDKLPALERFSDIVDAKNFVPAPGDWQVAISDVRGSTKAIAAGRYKEVNMAGAASIVALLNVAGGREIPFVFGGDGATLLIPPELLGQARAALAGVRAMARREFGLELRVGFVPVAEVCASGAEVLVARMRVSEHYDQAVFSGGGLAFAEHLIKDPELGPRYALAEADSAEEADLSGLECRWQDVPSRHGETLSLLVMAAPGSSPLAASAVYREAIAQIEAAYGSERDYHPLSVSRLRANFNPLQLLAETKLRTPPGPPTRLRYLLEIWGTNIGVSLYRIYQAARGQTPWWDAYREVVFRTADYKKYDDTLRMIIAGNAAQRERLTAYLEDGYRRGQLVYGIHVTDRALMTCLVFERMGRQVHFVDGADGGYALAAKAMKEQLRGIMQS